MNFLFVGHGRVARHLSHYLSAEGHKAIIWSRRSTTDLEPLIEKAQVICVSTRDHEIQGAISAYGLRRADKPLIHFSGSQHIEGAYGFHPLMTFGPELYDLQVYRSMHFVGVPSQRFFRQCFPNFKNAYHEIEPQKLALYHAYCAMAGNFPQILWNEISQSIEKDLEISSEVLSPYIRQVAENFIVAGSNSITGPLARNDNRTLVKHLDALSGNRLQSIYFSFLNFFQKKYRTENTHESHGISTKQI